MKRVGESEVELTINMESEMRRKRNKVTSKVEMKKLRYLYFFSSNLTPCLVIIIISKNLEMIFFEMACCHN